MRRGFFTGTLLATLLSSPAPAAAQTAQNPIIIRNERSFPNYVNAAECGGGVAYDIRWTTTLMNGATSFPAGGQYTLYAANQSHTKQDTGGGTVCWTTANQTTGLVAGPVSGPTTGAGLGGEAKLVDLGLLISKAGLSCASSGQTVYLCVQGALGSANFSFATDTVLVETTRPRTPVMTGAGPGNRALNLAWDPGTAVSGAEPFQYVLEAAAIGANASSDPTPIHTSGRVGSSPYRLEGLVNDVVYAVRVYAYSKADNVSDPSSAVTGMPQAVTDFWETYKAAGGRDEGGCSSGLAGPLGLALLAGTLALVRRRT